VATLVPCPHLANSTLIALADQALYQAKAAGRDRTILQQQPDFLTTPDNSGNFSPSNGNWLLCSDST
jgi:hypothetical protein